MKQVIVTFLVLVCSVFQVRAQSGEKHGTIYTVAEEAPEFPGGMAGMRKFLMENTHAPENVLANERFGGCKVFIKFVVNEDGKISDPEVVKGCSGYGDCDNTAEAIVLRMPPWKPGKINGKPVKVYYNLPLIFKPEEQD